MGGNNRMSYLEWRIKYKVQITFIAWLLILLSVSLIFITPHIFYFTLGLLILLELIEDIFLKCPKCKGRPGGWIFQIGERCKRCGTRLVDYVENGDGEHP